MPPKKNSENFAVSAKGTKEKAPRKRAIKGKVEKPKPKTPTVLRLKLPPIKSFISTSNQISPSRKNKKATSELTPAAQRKIDLANEVALAQLVKKNVAPAESTAENVINEPAAKKLIKSALDPPKPKGRPKKTKIESAASEAPALTTEDPQIASPEKSTKVLPNKKRDNVKKVRPKISKKDSLEPEPECEVIAKSSNNQKAVADSTSTEVKIKRTYARKRKHPEDQQPEPESNVHKPKAESIIATSSPAKMMKRKGKNKRLVEVSTNDHNQSPSVLVEASELLKKEVTQPEKRSQSIPAPIDSRKTSSSECLSWTKDISSSSTTTCKTVGSNDFVRIDKKLPILRLSNVGNEWKKVNEIPEESQSEDEDRRSSSSSSSSNCSSCSSSSSSSRSTDRQSSRNSIRQSLNLSVSTVSPSKSFVTHTSVTKDEDWNYALKKMSANFMRLDTEAMNWVGYEKQITNSKIKVINDKLIKLFKFESNIMEFHKNIRNYLESDNGTTEDIENHGVNKASAEVDPNVFTDKSEDDNFQSTESRYVMFDQNCAPEEDSLQTRVCDDGGSEGDNHERDEAPFDQTDDDDALSIFAESITCLESSRYNSSANSVCANASDNEEYTPPMVSKQKILEVFNYIPTKIDEIPHSLNYRNKIICEKQNADSTSVVTRDTKLRKNEEQSKALNIKQGCNSTQTVMRQFVGKTPSSLKKKPVLMTQVHKPLRGTKSIVFRGICFYNLISNCKKIRCTYPHVDLDAIEVRNRLSRLTEETFIQEYMLLRNWPCLRRRYGLLYVLACQDRKLTRILVEMAIDFISKAKLDSVDDAVLKINVSERTLLHLNDKDLSICEDLLRFDFGKNILLCHELLRTVGESQNFSRFKVIFVKLTNFIKDMDLSFHLDVANLILERVCILPFEESLAQAMCTILLRTDARIFENSLISTFENQIHSFNQDVYYQYCIGKENAISRLKQAQIANEIALSPNLTQEMDTNLIHGNREERYTSPDTTKNDSNKSDESSQVVQKVIRQSNQNAMTTTVPTVQMENMVQTRPKFHNWRGKGFASPHNMGMRFPRPPLLKRPLDRQRAELRATPSKCPRRPGPGFF